MNFEEALENFGKKGALASVYENLHGIELDEIEILDNENLVDWFAKIGEFKNKWVFVNDNSLTLVYVEEEEGCHLMFNNLKSLNHLIEKDDWFYGAGFRLHKAKLTDTLWAIRVCTSDIILSSLLEPGNVINPTQLEWLKGINDVVDAHKIPKNDRSLKNFINRPVWFKAPLEHVIIPKNSSSDAYNLIDLLLHLNGGREAFKRLDSDSNELPQWEYIHEGRRLIIGYLPGLNCVRVNKVDTIIQSDEESNLKEHELGPLIRSIVPGIDEEILPFWNETIDFPAFYISSESAQNLHFSTGNNILTLSRFRNIVLKNAPSDPFLKIDPESVVDWLTQKSDREIYFDHPNRFSCTVYSSGSDINLMIKPSRIENTLWTDIKLDNLFDSKLAVRYSEPFKLEKIVSVPRTYNNRTHSNQNKEEHSKFFEKNVLPEREESFNKSTADSKSRFLRWFLLLLGVILLFLLLRNCANSDDPDFYFNRGLEESLANNYSDASDDFSRTIEIDPNYIDAYKERARISIDENKPQEALFDLDNAISKDQTDWELFHLRGLAKMELSNSKYSSRNKEAIADFTKSIELNASIENAKSFYYRGKVFEYVGDDRACIDYYQACDFGFKDSCSIVDQICYPSTGFMPYDRFFGPGIRSGNKSFEVDNSNGETDVVASLVRISNNQRVRAQFVRAGSTLVMEGIPTGQYKLQMYRGNNWSRTLLLKDGISKGGFLIDPSFVEVENIWVFNRDKQELGVILNSQSGDLSSRTINENEFFR